MPDSFLLARLPIIESQIVAYENAITALSNGVESYSLDTGQTQQRVTRVDLDRLQSVMDELYNRRAVIRVRCGLDDGGHIGEPGY